MEPAGHAATASGHGRDIGTLHLLVVDDEPRVLRLCERYLQGAVSLAAPGTATELHLCRSGQEAVETGHTIAARGEFVVCALADLLLGGEIDGIGVMCQIWELDPDVQCTLITGAGDLAEKEIVSRIPPALIDRWDFLAKPFTRLEVTQRVRRSLFSWLAHRRAELRGAELVRSRSALQVVVEARTRELSERNVELEEKTRELESALRDIEQAQAMLLQQEKMASIGVLAAGVAHELNNPISFVHSNLGTLGRYCEKLLKVLGAYERRLPADPGIEALRKEEKLSFIVGDLPAMIRESLEGTERVRKIVADLKVFSHPAEKEARYADLNECLTSTLNIVHNELKYKARVVTDLGDVPRVRCRAGEINQVFMNLFVNACHALQGQGEIRVATRADGDAVVISVADTGCGIPEGIRARIFDPFFTTKPAGQGTGLGLAISYDIVRKHGGTIAFESEVGRGTTFTIRLPVAGSPEKHGSA